MTTLRARGLHVTIKFGEGGWRGGNVGGCFTSRALFDHFFEATICFLFFRLNGLEGVWRCGEFLQGILENLATLVDNMGAFSSRTIILFARGSKKVANIIDPLNSMELRGEGRGGGECR